MNKLWNVFNLTPLSFSSKQETGLPWLCHEGTRGHEVSIITCIKEGKHEIGERIKSLYLGPSFVPTDCLSSYVSVNSMTITRLKGQTVWEENLPTERHRGCTLFILLRVVREDGPMFSVGLYYRNPFRIRGCL